MDYLATTSIFTFANEQELVNHKIGKASPIARYLTTYFLARDPSVEQDFADELRTLVEHLAGALGVKITRVDVDIPKVVVPMGAWPKLPTLELCAGSLAAVNGLPFAKTDGEHMVPIGFRPPASRRGVGNGTAASTGSSTSANSGAGASVAPSSAAGDIPKGTATILPVPAH